MKRLFGCIAPLSLALVLSIAVSCGRNPYKVDVSQVELDMEVNRLELDLFGADPAKIGENIPLWEAKYGDFLRLFGWVINAGDIGTPEFETVLLSFCTDRQNNAVFDDVMEVFPSVTELEVGLEGAFRHYKYYFPEKVVPEVYTCITGFNNSLVVGDSVVGISLDRYLGRESVYYPQLGLYNYMIARMAPEYIVPDVVYGWGSTEWDKESMEYPSANVLTEMIHEGKLRFFQKSMLPEVNDTLLFGFTGDQMRFCQNNESQMWTYLMEQELLFNTDRFTITKLVEEAPFTSYFTNESPGRAATWIGFRIVESYMKNSGSSLGEMMAITDVQAILNGARYAP